MAYGTLTIGDLLATQNTIVDIGEDRAFQAIDTALAIHREQVAEITGSLIETTTERLTRYGGLDSMTMDEVDEMGRADAQKVTAGTLLGFPMTLKQVSLQWNRRWFEQHTGRELALQVNAAMDADVKGIIRDAMRAIFYPTNRTVIDRLVDAASIPVKALVNADSAAIPPAPDGSTFTASTHTHYLGTGSLAIADIQALIDTVAEHYTVGKPVVYINRAQEAAVRALTAAGGFIPYTLAQLVQPTNAVYIDSPRLDTSNLYDRAIGVFGNQGAEVVVKPWIPASYIFCYVQGAPKPLKMRLPLRGQTGLNLVADNESYPLRAQTMEHIYGIAPHERTNGAVLYTANATYAAPTIN